MMILSGIAATWRRCARPVPMSLGAGCIVVRASTPRCPPRASSVGGNGWRASCARRGCKPGVCASASTHDRLSAHPAGRAQLARAQLHSQRPTGSGWPPSPQSRRAEAGSIWQGSWTSLRGRPLAMPWTAPAMSGSSRWHSRGPCSADGRTPVAGAPFGSRQPVHRHRLPGRLGVPQHRAEHEWEGELYGNALMESFFGTCTAE